MFITVKMIKTTDIIKYLSHSFFKIFSSRLPGQFTPVPEAPDFIFLIPLF